MESVYTGGSSFFQCWGLDLGHLTWLNLCFMKELKSQSLRGILTTFVSLGMLLTRSAHSYFLPTLMTGTVPGHFLSVHYMPRTKLICTHWFKWEKTGQIHRMENKFQIKKIFLHHSCELRDFTKTEHNVHFPYFG